MSDVKAERRTLVQQLRRVAAQYNVDRAGDNAHRQQVGKMVDALLACDASVCVRVSVRVCCVCALCVCVCVCCVCVCFGSPAYWSGAGFCRNRVAVVAAVVATGANSCSNRSNRQGRKDTLRFNLVS